MCPGGINLVAKVPCPQFGIVEVSIRTLLGVGHCLGSFFFCLGTVSVHGSKSPCSGHTSCTMSPHSQQTGEGRFISFVKKKFQCSKNLDQRELNY